MSPVPIRPIVAITGPTPAAGAAFGAQASTIEFRSEKFPPAFGGDEVDVPPTVPVTTPKSTTGDGPAGSIGPMFRSDRANAICHCRCGVAEFNDAPKPLCNRDGITWDGFTPVLVFGPS